MKISKVQIEVPNVCPEQCPGKKESWSLMRGGLCHRCPILNCAPHDVVIGESDASFTLIPPEHYHEDWALAWAEWFENGMEGYPELCL